MIINIFVSLINIIISAINILNQILSKGGVSGILFIFSYDEIEMWYTINYNETSKFDDYFGDESNQHSIFFIELRNKR